jgi:hypothetical protein
MHISQGILKGYFKSNPFRQQKLKIFAKERPKFDSLILNYNSPLKPMFLKGTIQLIQTGIKLPEKIQACATAYCLTFV